MYGQDVQHAGAISFPISFLMLLVLTFGDSANSCMLGRSGLLGSLVF